MNQDKLQTLKGFRDFLPEDARKRAWLRRKMIEVFELWGYEPLESPTLEPLALFEGEIGEDEKLFYKFEDNGGRKVALRYDQTVPTARIVGQYFDKLVFPFKRYQIQSNFRAEKPQKGRFREFVQADIDIFGIASPIADAEAIAVSIDLYKKLGFKRVVAKINSRGLMKDIPYNAIVAIDKLGKIGDEGVVADMVAKGISPKEAESYLERVKNLKPDDTLNTIFDYLEKSGFSKENYEFAPTIARSFSYSEGPIWEMVVPDYSGGSVGGGERYDSMMKRITGRDIPAVGIAFGFDRTLEAAEELGLIPDLSVNCVLVTVFSSELLSDSLEVAATLRGKGIPTLIYPATDVKLDKQLKYADRKQVPWVIIIGQEEKERKVIQVKNMKTGEQKTLPIEEVVTLIS